mmetsp:Transcript_18249/g.37953  ORF Transcript_18249/g.37953 Transcript_18249/m.37953 type:complete len:669 (-) Transcript_18249:12-2018(-)
MDITHKSRWKDVERTAKMLSKTSCPASTAFVMTNIKVNPKIANTIDYKIKDANKKTTKATIRPPPDKTKGIYAQPPMASRGSKKTVTNSLLAEFSVAFRDHCKYTPYNNKRSNNSTAPPVFVQSPELLAIFRQVEDSYGGPVVSTKRLKAWIKSTGFDKQQALSYAEFMKLCSHVIDLSDPMRTGAKKSLSSSSLKSLNSTNKMGSSVTTGRALNHSFSATSWDDVPYENYGKLTNLKKNQSTAAAPPLISTSQSTPTLEPFSKDSTTILPGGDPDGPSRAHTPYLITKRKSAAASLFEYDENAPDLDGPVKVDPDEMVNLVKRQNRDARRRQREEETRLKNANQPPPPKLSIGDRLFDAQLQSVSVEGDHLIRSSQAEIFRRTQGLKNDLREKSAKSQKMQSMANSLNTKLAVVLSQITETKSKQLAKEHYVDKINLVADRKQNLQTAKLKKKAKADRTVLQRRKTAQLAKSEIDRALIQREIAQANMLDKLKHDKKVVRRTSVSFTPSKIPENADKKLKKAEKQKHSDLFKKSLDSMLEVKESRKGMKTVLATSQIPIGGEELFEDEFDSPGKGTVSPTGSFEMNSRFSIGSAGSRPKSRGELLPPSMFSAERIYDKGRAPPPQVPFGTTAPRSVETPASVLRTIHSPEARAETAGKLISSPTPWS